MEKLSNFGGDKTNLPKMDLDAFIYIKCEKNKSQKFQADFISTHFGETWICLEKNEIIDQLKPLRISAVAGYWDFILLVKSSSLHALSEYCLDHLRGQNSEGLSECIRDTQSSIGTLIQKTDD